MLLFCSSEWPLSKKSTNNKCWREYGETGTLLHCWWECKLENLWRTGWRSFRKLKITKKLKIELPFDPAIPLLGIYPEKNMTWKDTYMPVFTAAVFTIAKTRVQFSSSVVSNSLQPNELQHARPPSPSPTPGVYSNSCPLSWWCHPAISSSVVPSPPAPIPPSIRVFSKKSVLRIRWTKYWSFSFSISPSNEWIFRTDFL